MKNLTWVNKWIQRQGSDEDNKLRDYVSDKIPGTARNKHVYGFRLPSTKFIKYCIRLNEVFMP